MYKLMLKGEVVQVIHHATVIERITYLSAYATCSALTHSLTHSLLSVCSN